jgi:hypothetical protein
VISTTEVASTAVLPQLPGMRIVYIIPYANAAAPIARTGACVIKAAPALELEVVLAKSKDQHKTLFLPTQRSN